MNRRKHVFWAPVALGVAVVFGVAHAAPSVTSGNGQSNGRWGEVFQGKGNVTETRCLGMSRGSGCITAASRKEAARRAAEARAAAEQPALAPAPTSPGKGGKKK